MIQVEAGILIKDPIEAGIDAVTWHAWQVLAVESAISIGFTVDDRSCVGVDQRGVEAICYT